MLALAFPIVALYMGAVGVAWIIDRRRARRRAADPVDGLSDDEASPAGGGAAGRRVGSR